MYVISLILLWLPNIFFLLAMRVIRFKSHKRCDEFVLLWNTGYRLANIFFTFFSITLFQALQCLRDSPDEFLQTLAFGIIRQSSFLMNLIILATGQETMLQLLQWRSLIKQALFRPLINLNARSRRFIDWLKAPPGKSSLVLLCVNVLKSVAVGLRSLSFLEDTGRYPSLLRSIYLTTHVLPNISTSSLSHLHKLQNAHLPEFERAFIFGK